MLTDEQAPEARESRSPRKSDKRNAPIDADRAAPPSGGDGSAGAYRQRRRLQQLLARSGIALHDDRRPQARVAASIDPPDGRVPRADRQARRATRSRAPSAPTSDQAIREDDPGFEGADAYDDPEQRPLGERCLIGFSSTSGPPILPTYFYNNLHQIVQTPDTVLILTEMVHDARIVRMNAQHLPPTIRKWMGDSIGRWDGDTLVIDTTNFTDKTRFRGSSEALHIVERLTRVDAEDAALPVHDRGSDDVDEAVDRRNTPGRRPTS